MRKGRGEGEREKRSGEKRSEVMYVRPATAVPLCSPTGLWEPSEMFALVVCILAASLRWKH